MITIPYILYHIRHGIVSTTLFSHQSIEDKCFMEKKRQEIGKILRQLCEWKGVKLLNAEACPDHVHMLVEIPPNKLHGISKRKE